MQYTPPDPLSRIRLWPYLRRESAALAGAYVCMGFLALAGAALAFLSGPALSLVFSGQTPGAGNTSALLHVPGQVSRALGRYATPESQRLVAAAVENWVPLFLVITAIVKGVAQAGQFYLMGRLSGRVARALRLEAFEHLMKQSMSYFQTTREGDLVSRLTHEIGVVEHALFYGLAPLLRDTLAVVTLLGFCLYSDPKLAGVTAMALVVAGFPLQRFGRWLKRVSRTSQAKMGEMAAICHEAVAGARLVQTHQGEAQVQARLARANAAYLKEMQESYWVRAIRSPTLEILGTTGLALLLVFLGRGTRQASSGHFISFFAALLMMYDPLKKLGQVGEHLIAGRVALERLGDILKRPPEIGDRPGARAASPLRRSLEFRQVSAAYNKRQVLHNISFTVQAGERIGIVGPSGAGKSTLVQLVPRLLDVSEGAVLWDGADLRDLTLASLRRHLTLVSQDTFLLNASVEENIAFAQPNTRAADIVEAARAACAHEFILALPQGYQTPLGERGQSLSGGQRQRLAIARAWLRDTSMLILDEATSALDNASEALVQRAVEDIQKNRTTFVIAHRLSSVERCDRILYFADGRLVESGTHKQLLDQDGAYRKLWSHKPTAQKNASPERAS